MGTEDDAPPPTPPEPSPPTPACEQCEDTGVYDAGDEDGESWRRCPCDIDPVITEDDK
jgi:hypothetical protein